MKIRFMKRPRQILKKIMVGGLTLSLLAGSFRLPVFAEETDSTTDATNQESEVDDELQAAYKIAVESNELDNWPEGPGTYGEGAIVMEVGTGAILYAKNIDAHFYPASITKLLTALVAFENADLDDEVRVTEECIDFLEWDDARINLEVGNKLSLKNAMYALLLASANDAAYAIGQSVGENAGHDYDWFIKQMNKRCKELGGKNSNFVNTNGLHDDNHYTCARDMALIARELYKYPEVFTIMQTVDYTIPKSKTIDEHYFYQYHQMLLPANANYYEYAIGGKTGYTDQALSTLVTMTDKDGYQLVCVVLKTHGVNVYPDTRNLIEYAYDNFKKVSVKKKEKSEYVEGILEEDNTGYVVLPDDVKFKDLDLKILPDDEDGKDCDEGTLEYYYEDQYVGNARATLTKAYFKDLKKQEKEEAKKKSKSKESSDTSSKTSISDTEESQSTTATATTTATTATEDSLMDRWWENYVDALETIFQPIIKILK